jgi:hypothetical protein
LNDERGDERESEVCELDVATVNLADEGYELGEFVVHGSTSFLFNLDCPDNIPPQDAKQDAKRSP